MLCDTHVHLQSKAYSEDLKAVLKRASEANISACIIPGTTLTDSRDAIALAERYSTPHCAIYAAVGIHPTNAGSLTPDALVELREMARHPRVVAIGEIGLDYYWPKINDRGWPCAEPDEQRTAFTIQLELAAEFEFPVIVHDRDAHEDVLHILKTWVSRKPERTGSLHAYAGGPGLLGEALDFGFYIGMDGPVTFKKAKNLHAVAQQVPLNRLLLETDGPYLTPIPHRGKRNEPAYLSYIAERIAELRGVPSEAIVSTTTANAKQLFGI